MTLPYPNTVAQAAKDLDKLMPGWYNKVDVDELRMMDCEKCIIAQSFSGKYHIGRDNWGWDIQDTSEGPFTEQKIVPKWADEINKRKTNSIRAMKQKRDKLGRFASGSKIKKIYKAVKRAILK